jgi:hypothetical protein
MHGDLAGFVHAAAGDDGQRRISMLRIEHADGRVRVFDVEPPARVERDTFGRN